MNLFYNLVTRGFQKSLTDEREITCFFVKRGDEMELRILPIRDGAAVTLSGFEEMVFAVKSAANGDDPLILANAFVRDSGTGFYESPLTQDTDAIEALLDAATVDFIDVFSELEITDADGTIASKTSDFRIYNDLWKGSEGTPLSLPTPDEWLEARAVLYTAQTLTAPEQLQARDNIGLDDGDGKIPETLFPDIITVDGVTLADGSGVELPDGTLALDGSTPPKLMLHDGETTGGVPAEGWIMRGAGSLNLATDNVATEKVIVLADLVLPLGFIPDTTGVEKIFIQGQVAVHANSIANYNPSIDPRLLFYFVEAPGASGSPRGIGAVIGTGGISDTFIGFTINSQGTISYTSGTSISILGATPSHQSTKRSITSGNVVTDSLATMEAYGSSLQRTAPATGPVTLRCAVILPPDAATANATGYIRAACNLRLHFA